MRSQQTQMYVFTALVFLFTLLCSIGEALEPDKDLSPPNLKPTIPVFEVPKVKAKAVGVIERRGTTSYMYGTHILKPDTGYKPYALKSDSLNLDKYIGEKVKVSGELIDGYPVEGGPDFMNVESIYEFSQQ